MSKKGFFHFKIGLTLVSLFFAIVTKSDIDYSNFKNIYIDPVLAKELIYDLSICIFSSMILVLFIDEISARLYEKSSREKERAEIKRFNKVLQCYLDQYKTFYYCVVTPLNRRNFENIEMPENFKLHDMKDLHYSTTLAKERINRSSVSAFLQIEFDLRQQIISIIEHHEFNYFPEFVDIFLKYIDASLNYDSRSAILTPASPSVNGKPWYDNIQDLLENEADEYYEQAKQGEDMSGTIAHPYIFLYEMMNAERDLINQYQSEIQKLA